MSQDNKPSNIEIEEPIKHHWWHKIFENWYKTTMYRDGFLGSLTPDFNESYYRCGWFGCKWTKIVKEYFR